MKTRIYSPSLLSAFALVIAQFPPLLGAAEPTPAPPSPPAAAQSDPNPEATRVNLQFEGAELTRIVSFLREKFPGANFMVQPKAETIRVTLNVRNVSMEQALQAVAFASDGRVAVDRLDYRFYGLILADPAALETPRKSPPAGSSISQRRRISRIKKPILSSMNSRTPSPRPSRSCARRIRQTL